MLGILGDLPGHFRGRGLNDEVLRPRRGSGCDRQQDQGQQGRHGARSDRPGPGIVFHARVLPDRRVRAPLVVRRPPRFRSIRSSILARRRRSTTCSDRWGHRAPCPWPRSGRTLAKPSRAVTPGEPVSRPDRSSDRSRTKTRCEHPEWVQVDRTGNMVFWSLPGFSNVRNRPGGDDRDHSSRGSSVRLGVGPPS